MRPELVTMGMILAGIFFCFKYQAHWTMYCAMSFRWHNFQSIVDTFKTINYDKVLGLVMNDKKYWEYIVTPVSNSSS